MSEYVKSPINYIGCKYQLLPYILPHFPKDIDTFIDVFGGSATVCFNVKADKIVHNDIIPHISRIFNTWKQIPLENLLKYFKQYQSISEELFKALRWRYNQYHEPNILFILICNSYNGQMRFNNSLEYNSSYAKGIRYLTDNILKNIELIHPLLNTIEFSSKDFRDMSYSELTENDFVYFDPPYLISQGVYQDGKRGFKGWNKQDDIDLFNICDTLTTNGVKWCMSNVFESKGKVNTDLIGWSKQYNVVHIQANYNLGARKTTKHKDDEVLIKNY